MNLSMGVLIVASLIGVYCDCGCLTCGRHLRVVSPPSAPCKIIHRGYSCNCPKLIPYTVEIPKPACYSCPVRNYDCRIETVDFAKPIDPKFSYTYDVQVPVKNDCKCKYLNGLVAIPDRIVLPAVDDCIPEKPTCPGPIIEYLPHCEEEIYTRGKRESTFNSIITPKTSWLELVKNEISLQFKKLPKRTLLVNQRPVNKPFRISIPLTVKRKFFPYKKPTRKPKDQIEKIDQLRPETHFISGSRSKGLERKRQVEILQNWGKFADIPNVEIQNPFQKAWGERTRRSLDFDEDSYPFYKISEALGETRDAGLEVADESILESKLMRPFDVENLLPHTPFFYLINAPIRALNHFHKLRQHVSPVVKSVPVVIDSSSGYISNLGKKLRNAGFELLGSFAKTLPGKNFLDLLFPLKRGKRLANMKRGKGAIFKMVDEDDVHDFLREKLSIFSEDAPPPDDDFLTPVTLETVQESKVASSKPKKLLVEKLLPKVTFDKGKPLIDVNGVRKPIPTLKRRRPLRLKTIHDEHDNHVKDTIENLIEEAKLMATHRSPSTKNEEIEMPLQIIKEKISQTLDEIEKLIDIVDFDDSGHIYEELLRLQILKGALVNDWKAILINKKHNDIGEKIHVLNSIHEIQSIKDRIVEEIVLSLLGDYHIDSQNLIKMLVRLQKLQCVLVRVVEDFGEKIRLRTPFDVQKEIKYVDFLEGINFVVGKNSLEVGDELRKERSRQIEKRMMLLDNLKTVLSKENDEGFSRKIDEVAKQLWEVRNLEKLQRETILELDDKLQTEQKIRRELKILFDLQKQLEICEGKQNDLFKDIHGKKEVKTEDVNTIKAKMSRKLKALKFGNRKSSQKKAPIRWGLNGKTERNGKLKKKIKGIKDFSDHKLK